MKKNKIIAVLMIFSLCLTSCGNYNEDNDNTDDIPTMTAEYTDSEEFAPTETEETEEGTKVSIDEKTDDTEKVTATEKETTVRETKEFLTETASESTVTTVYTEITDNIPETTKYTQTTATESKKVTSAQTTTSHKTEYSKEDDKIYEEEDAPEEDYEEETTAKFETNATDVLVSARRTAKKSKYTDHNEVIHTYSYNSLTNVQKFVYDAVVESALLHRSRVYFDISDKVTFDDLFAAYQMLYLDEVRLFYLSTEFEYYEDGSTEYVTQLNIKYLYDKDKTEEMQSEIDNAADEILSQITSDMTDYDIVKLIHDSIITNTTYTLEGNQDDIMSVYGVLGDKKAQCQGYARAFSYLCNLCGIETDIVLGVAGEDHMWNMVKLNDKWYHIDLTWDDPDKEDFPDSVRYDYFCVTTDRMLELRTIEGNSHELPAADSDDLEYYNYNNLVAYDIDDAREIFKSEAIRCSEEKSSTIQFRCDNSEVYEDVIANFFDGNIEGNIIEMIDSIEGELVNKIDTDTVYHQGNYNTLIIKVFLNYE